MKKQEIESSDPREVAIEYCKALRKDIKRSKAEVHPISKRIEDELKKVCKIPTEENLDKYPELKAIVEKQKSLEIKTEKVWKTELQKVMRKNSLTEKDIKEEDEE